MKTIHIISRLVVMIAIFSLCSCGKDKNEPCIEPRFTEIDLSVFVADIVHTKAAPPDGDGDGGTDIIGVSEVDRVRVVTFRRPKNSTGAFTYDQSNDIKLLCQDEQGVRKARGKIKSEVGYEYQTLVFGYAVERGEESGFNFGTLTDGVTTMADFKLNINSVSETIEGGVFTRVASSELFYGYCHTGDNQRIFSNNDNKISLEGMLFRCVGQLSLSITNIPMNEGVDQMVLFAETVHSQSNTSDYSDFKITQTPIAVGEWKVMSNYKFIGENVTAVHFKVFMLAVDTRVKIRVIKNGTFTDYILKYESVGDDSNATGIITPAAHEDMLYIRRNKQYNISGEYTLFAQY